MRNFLFLLLALTLVNCATFNTPDGQPLPDAKEASSGDDDSDDSDEVAQGPEDEAPIRIGKGTIADLSDSESDMGQLPEDFNQHVTMWLDYFQGRGRHHMVRYLGRSTRYLPLMKEILKKHGLPEDLVYLALIESGFNGKALSRARASGYWQFIRGTGRRYDLRIDYYTDERSDFVQSTEAAALYLKALYNLFGSWYLAIASYNVGENRVKGLVMKYYTRDFWEFARRKKLPKETIHYVPKFIAARMIAKHPERYGFTDVEYMPPLNFQEIEFDKAVSLPALAQQLGMDYEELHGLNLAFKKGIIPKYGDKVMVRVPANLNKDQVLAALGNSSTDVAVKMAANSIEDAEFTKYRIRNGDTLSTIARRFRVSMSHLIEINDLSRRAVLRVGRVLRIPKGASERLPASRRKNSSYKDQQKTSLKKIAATINLDMKRKPVKQKVHVVRTGETLLNIANRYNVRLSKLIAANKLRSSQKILIGSRLVIPR